MNVVKICIESLHKDERSEDWGGVWLWYEIKAKWEHSERHVPAPGKDRHSVACF